MTSRVFQRADVRFLIDAVVAVWGHKEFNRYEAGLPISTANAGNLTNRASQLVTHLFEVMPLTEIPRGCSSKLPTW